MTDHCVPSVFPDVYVLQTGAGSGQWNMEFDALLMRAFSEGLFERRFGAGAVLWRFYTWKPSAVSLGYSQRADVVDYQRCSDAGIDVVRRPTGGRAVFHADEFTYSFLARTEYSNADVYRLVHDVLCTGLLDFRVHAVFCRSDPDFRQHYKTGHAASCFSASARYELQADGRKLVGSAQRRTGGVLLQHGSLMLTERYRRLHELLVSGHSQTESRQGSVPEESSVSVRELTGRVPSYDELCRSMNGAVRRLWGVEPKALDARDIESLF
ncbi:MAG: lipoate--protein ligase family protein [Prosthecochloris sp.]|nr:lipoate--protein ligase family protein [Prosthecochloris sp.]